MKLLIRIALVQRFRKRERKIKLNYKLAASNLRIYVALTLSGPSSLLIEQRCILAHASVLSGTYVQIHTYLTLGRQGVKISICSVCQKVQKLCCLQDQNSVKHICSNVANTKAESFYIYDSFSNSCVSYIQDCVLWIHIKSLACHFLASLILL